MVRITMRDSHRSIRIRAETGVKDIEQVVKKQKWRWAGQIARINDNRWTGAHITMKEAERGPALDGEMT